VRHPLVPALQRRPDPNSSTRKETSSMITRTVAVFRDGSFTSEPAPDWLMAACEHAGKDNRSWDEVLTDTIGNRPSFTKVEDDTSCSGEVIDWITPGGGRYVEFWDAVRAVAEVWIPDPADWLAFYSAHLLPFLQTHAEIAIAYHLDRIGNCLIAHGRHGEGRHIDLYSGRSQIDINRQRERAERLRKASA
jgi:hypothetical protein